jgi:hypothetical protein
VELDLVEDGSL